MCCCCRSPYLSRYWSAIHKSLESQTEQWICPQVTTLTIWHGNTVSLQLAVYKNHTNSMFRKVLGIVKQTTWISCGLAFYMSNKINFDFVTEGKTYDVDLFSVSPMLFFAESQSLMLCLLQNVSQTWIVYANCYAYCLKLWPFTNE